MAAVAAGALVLLAARRGPGLSPDSLEYLGVARNLLHHGRLTLPFGTTSEGSLPGAPMTSFPPLYPVLLAIGGAGVAWARVLNLVLALVTTAATAAIVGRHARTLVAAACITGLLFAPDFVRVHAEVWSEPLLLAIVAMGTVALLRHLDRPHRATLIPVLAACALAPMARYVGVVFVAAVVVLARRHRVHDAIAASAAGLAPLAMWLVWGAVASGAEGAAGRTPAWHPPAVGEVITQLTRTVGTFWVSGYGPRLGLVVIALVLATVTPRRSEYLVYGVILVVGTVALLLVTWAVLDRTTVLDSRLLVLAHLGAVLALPFVVGSGRWREGALACAAALVLVGSIHWSVGFAASESRQYAADEWRRSPTLAAAEALGAAPLYSNRADLVWWATGRRTALLPVKTDLRSGSARPWQREVGRLPAGALVVLFDRAPGRFMLSAAELGSVRAVRLVRRLPDGAIYEIEARGAQPH